MSKQIIIGDCVDVLPTLPPADLILTSPPYGDMRLFGFHPFNFLPVADAIVRALKPGGVLVWVVADQTINGSETGDSLRQALYFKDAGLLLHDTMIWEKPFPIPIENKGRYVSSWEYMFVFSLGQPKTTNLIEDRPLTYPITNRGLSLRQPKGNVRHSKGSGHNAFNPPTFGKRKNIWSVLPEATPKAHPGVFPIALATDHIITWTNPGDVVIDPMCGSGTTVRAAVNTGRQGFGIEIHEPYAAIAKDRLRQQALI